MIVYSTPFRPFVTGILLMLLILLWESILKIAGGTTAYVLVSLLMLWCVRTSKLAVAVGIVSTLFLSTLFLFPFINPQADPAALINRVVAILVVWFAVFFIARFKKLQETERREKRQLSALVSHANEGILLIDSAGKIVVANPSAGDMFGYRPADMVGKNLVDFIPTYKEDRNRQVSSQSIVSTWTGVRHDGSEFPVDINLSEFYEGGSRVLIAFVLNATERVRNEELVRSNLKMASDYNLALQQTVQVRTAELETANHELRKSQTMYHSMARNFPDGFIGIMDRGLRWILVDGKGLGDLGLNADSILRDRVFDNIHGAISTYAEGALKHAFDGGTVSFDLEISGKYYNVSAVPVETSGAAVHQILVVVKDISGQKSLERELVKTLEKEKGLNVLKSRFVTLASHEFRTPLTTILSSAYLLENYTGSQLVDKKKHLDRIKRAVHGLTELLNDFLSLGRLEEGVVQVVYRPLDLKQFSEELLQEIALSKKEEQHIVFEFDGPATDVLVDKQLLRNILLNLLSNAIKYSPVSSTIGLSIVVMANAVKIKVSDQGIGIPTEEHKFVFKRFFRANNTSEIQGTGLGLNIVKRYVRLLKGKVEFRSRLNKGTVFTVTLPLKNTVESNPNH